MNRPTQQQQHPRGYRSVAILHNPPAISLLSRARAYLIPVVQRSQRKRDVIYNTEERIATKEERSDARLGSLRESRGHRYGGSSLETRELECAVYVRILINGDCRRHLIAAGLGAIARERCGRAALYTNVMPHSIEWHFLLPPAARPGEKSNARRRRRLVQ